MQACEGEVQVRRIRGRDDDGVDAAIRDQFEGVTEEDGRRAILGHPLGPPPIEIVNAGQPGRGHLLVQVAGVAPAHAPSTDKAN